MQRQKQKKQCEIVEHNGRVHGPFNSLQEANAYASNHLLDQEQDPDGTSGWDLRDVGCDDPR